MQKQPYTPEKRLKTAKNPPKSPKMPVEVLEPLCYYKNMKTATTTNKGANMETWVHLDGDIITLDWYDDGHAYGYGNKFDFERKTIKEAQKQLESWGYKKIAG